MSELKSFIVLAYLPIVDTWQMVLKMSKRVTFFTRLNSQAREEGHALKHMAS